MYRTIRKNNESEHVVGTYETEQQAQAHAVYDMQDLLDELAGVHYSFDFGTMTVHDKDAGITTTWHVEQA